MNRLSLGRDLGYAPPGGDDGVAVALFPSPAVRVAPSNVAGWCLYRHTADGGFAFVRTSSPGLGFPTVDWFGLVEPGSRFHQRVVKGVTARAGDPERRSAPLISNLQATARVGVVDQPCWGEPEIGSVGG